MEVPGEKVDGGVAPGKSSQHVLTCTPCERDGDHQPAAGFCQDCHEHLCRSCCKYHKRSKVSAMHVILDSGTMPKTKASTKPSQPSGCTVPCPKHGDKMLEFLCQQHSVVICYVCSTTEHKSCSVDYIPDISETFVKQSGYDSRVQRIHSIANYCQTTENLATDRDTQLSLACDNAETLVDRFYNKIISTVDKWKASIKHQVNEVKSTNKKATSDISEVCSAVKEGVASIQSRVDHLKTSGQHDRLLVELLQADKQLDQFETQLKTIEGKIVVSSIDFNVNESIQQVLKTESTLGTINKTRQHVVKYVQPKVKLSLEKKINVKTKEDNSTCWITGMAELSPTKLLLADLNNKAIKVLDTSTSSVTSRLDLSSGPWDVAVLPDLHQAVVTLPVQNTVQFVSTDRGLSELRKVKVDGECHGIAYARGQLVVTYRCPGRYQMLNVQGDVLFSSSPDIQLSDWPRYVTVSKDERHILISEGDNHRVVKLSWEGRVEDEYTDEELKCSRAVAACQDGSFYVCSYYTHTINRVSADCSKMAVVVKADEIQEPYGLCVGEDGKLYASCHTDSEIDNNMSVFQETFA